MGNEEDAIERNDVRLPTGATARPPMRSPSGDYLPGEVIAEKYELLTLLGEGGMGRVFKARHLLIDRLDAIKVMKRCGDLDPTSIKRFRSEAKAVSALSHPNIIAVHDFGITAEGLPYMAMEYVQGTSLDEMLVSAKRLPCDEAIEIFRQICDGLVFAHEKGIVHRDLKPSNILVTNERGSRHLVKIVDFGFGQTMENSAEQQNLTGEGEIPGTPAYMSPEQCQSWQLDARSDIYSLGCIMYETLTGERAACGSDVFAIVNAHLHTPPKLFADRWALPASLEAIVLKALAKDRNDRYQSVSELRRALSSVSSSDSSSGVNGAVAAAARHAKRRVQDERTAVSSSIIGGTSEALMQTLLTCTGKRLRINDAEWIAGPQGSSTIGREVMEEVAEETGLKLVMAGQNAGLLTNLAELNGETFNAKAVHPLIQDLFSRTGRYEIEMWSEWRGLPKLIVRALVATFGRTTNQLNLPLSAHDTIGGIRNEVVTFCREDSGRQIMSGWVRTLRATEKVMSASFVTTCSLPNKNGRYYKAIYPMPGGSFTSISRPFNDPDGGIRLVADGNRFGEPGYYRLNYLDNDSMQVMLWPVKQHSRIFVDADSVVRWDLSLRLWGMHFLTMYNRMIRA